MKFCWSNTVLFGHRKRKSRICEGKTILESSVGIEREGRKEGEVYVG